MFLKQSTAVEIALGPFVDSADGVTAETGLTITQADVRLKKNGADWAQKTEATSLVHEENGWYRCLLDATDTGTLGLIVVAVNESGALPVWKEYVVLAANVYDSIVGGGDVLDVSVTQWLGTAAATPTTAGVPEVDITFVQGSAMPALVGGRVDVSVGAIAAAAITAASIATDAIDADALAADAIAEIQAGLATSAALATVQADTDNIQTRLPAALVGGRIDASVGAMAADVLTASALAADAVTEIAAGVAAPSAATITAAVWDEDATGHQTLGSFGQTLGDSLGASSIRTIVNTQLDTTVSSRASAVDLGTLAGYVDTEVAAIKTVTDALPNAGALTTIQSDLDDIQARLPASLSSGRMRSTVEDIGTGVITADALAADAGAEIAAAVWERDATASQTQGSFGQVLGDSGADTDSVWALVNAGLGTTPPTAGAIADAVWDEARAGHVAAGSFGEGVLVQSVNTGGITAASLAADAGAEIGAAVWDTDATAHVAVGTFGEAIGDPAAPAGASLLGLAVSTFGFVETLQTVDVPDVLARLPATLSGGKMRSQVEGMDAGTVTAAAVATDAIDADALAASAVTEIQSGLATAAAVTAVQGQLPAALVGGRMDSSIGAMATDTLTAGALSAAAVAEIVDAVWDELRADHSVSGSFAESHFVIYSGSVTGAATTTTLVDSGLTQADTNHWRGRIIIWVTGPLKYQATDIRAFTPATDTLTFTALTQAPGAGARYVVL